MIYLFNSGVGADPVAEVAIRLDKVNKSFGSFHVLHDVSLDVPKGFH